MRHVIGIGLAVALILTMFFAGGWGYLRLRLAAPATGLPARDGSLLSAHGLLAALAALAAAGLAAGILVAAPRISPLAAGLPGLLLIGWTALYLTSVRRAVDLIPLRSYSFGAGWEGMLFNGILGGAGLALVVPLFLPSRWRRAGVPEDFEAAEARDLMADLTDGPDLGGGPRPFSPDDARTRAVRPGLPRATGSFPEL